ncbi:MAG: S1 RNA-binding domain-containing protein [Gammaproteobacteria bacterium]|nr:S1 RNA-binding domain-containing protein [Gammaproteobacteria bacterium]
MRRYSRGEEIDTVILSIDSERERISLGIKQLDDDPFNDFIEQHDRNSIVEGVVIAVEPKEVLVRLAPEVEGVLKASEIYADRVEDARTALSVGDEVTAKIVSIDR